MARTFSLHETKARLSAIIRQVREGQTIVVTVHGAPVAEIRPIPSSGEDVGARLEELQRRGVLVRPATPALGIRRVARRKGALERFLADRD
jgi:prevent-host-death family protein